MAKTLKTLIIGLAFALAAFFSNAKADDFHDMLDEIAALNQTGAMAVACSLRSVDWSTDLIKDTTPALEALIKTKYPKGISDIQAGNLIEDLLIKQEQAASVVPNDTACGDLKTSDLLVAADQAVKHYKTGD